MRCSVYSQSDCFTNNTSHNPNNNTLPLCCLVKQWMTAYRSAYVSTVALACRCRMKIPELVPACMIKGSRDHAIWFTYLSFLQQHSTECLSRNQMILYWHVVPISKGKFLHSAVSSPWDLSKRFTLYSRQTCSFQHQLDFSGKHSSILQLLRKRRFVHISPTLYIAMYSFIQLGELR